MNLNYTTLFPAAILCDADFVKTGVGRSCGEKLFVALLAFHLTA